MALVLGHLPRSAERDCGRQIQSVHRLYWFSVKWRAVDRAAAETATGCKERSGWRSSFVQFTQEGAGTWRFAASG